MTRDLLDRVAGGDRKALSRAISGVEEGDLQPPQKSAASPPVIGITGPPGAGKSTLIAAIVSQIRDRGQSVGILAVDPSSPITGGALLGDRIRMQTHADDEGVFIRSMATRGHLGGLTASASSVVDLMCSAGFDLVILETVGVGQSEVEVMDIADAVVLVVGPSWGDRIQADKAGIVEIADLFVVNKGDRPGADDVRRALLEAAENRESRILTTTATTGGGVAEVLAAIDSLAGG